MEPETPDVDKKIAKTIGQDKKSETKWQIIMHLAFSGGHIEENRKAQEIDPLTSIYHVNASQGDIGNLYTNRYSVMKLHEWGLMKDELPTELGIQVLNELDKKLGVPSVLDGSSIFPPESTPE